MIDAAVARYAAFFRLPDVTRMLVMAIVARMPIGTVTLALLLHGCGLLYSEPTLALRPLWRTDLFSNG